MGFFDSLETFWTLIGQYYPPRPTFSVDQIPDLAGQVVIVTGGNTGIGYETVKVLLEHNAKVYLAARSRERAEVAIASLKETTGREAIFLELDLASFSSIRKAAKEFLSKEIELHILFNNGGVMFPSRELVTEEGYDLQWGTNVVGHYYFTELLMSALLCGVKSSPDYHARVITTSSSGAYLDTLHWDTFKDGPERRERPITKLYFQSKLGNVVVARQLAKRYADKGIISISVNPGNIRTDLFRRVPSVTRTIMDWLMLHPVQYGALTQLFAGTMPEALDHNGEYMIPWARPCTTPPQAYDDQAGDRLWEWLRNEVKMHSEA